MSFLGEFMEKLTFTVEQAARLLGIGRNSAYDAVRRGEIPVLRIGHRYLVPRRALEALLDGTNQPLRNAA